MELIALGWRQDWEKAFAPYRAEGCAAGRIASEAKGLYRICTEHGEIWGEVAGRLRHQAAGRGDYPAVGDWVALTVRPKEGRGTIHAVLPRFSTGGIREDDGKGRHTTTRRELIVLPGGGMLIDTPGMRELQLWEAGEGLAAGFPDIEELAAGCRFHDCGHISEPGCAVQAALRSEALSKSRYNSYLKLQRELWKKIHRQMKQRTSKR